MQTFLNAAQLRRQQIRRSRFFLFFFGLLLLLAFMIEIIAGSIWLWPHSWFSDNHQIFIWQIRFPRAIVVIVVGASLAVSGAVMQALFENPLAEPGLLGVSNGAGVALVAVIIAGGGMLPVWVFSVAAIAGAMLITFLLLGFAVYQKLTNARLLLIGVAFSLICGAMMTWSVYFSTSIDLRQMMYWMMGGFSGISWQHTVLVIFLFPTLLWLCGRGKILNFLALGEIPARQLGLSLYRWRNLFVICVGVIVGLCVALAGVIGFVGLIVPHILRLFGMTDHRALLPGCAITGAALLLIADIIARIAIVSAELPIGVVTATLGAPLFIWLLLRKVSLT